MENRIRENGIEYELTGDYYIPALEIKNEERPIGKYGRMHREYLKQHHPGRYNILILRGKLWMYLADLNEQVLVRNEWIMEQMQEAEGITEEMKANNFWEWLKKMNNIHSRAEEIVLRELVYR